MNRVSSVTHSAAAAAFDSIASSYDEQFTRSWIGQAQRKQVWGKLLAAFPPGSRLLELNCGTGEDARFLTKKNRSVVACDASAAMIEIARRRDRCGHSSIKYLQLANEDLGLFPKEELFDGAFSNFSGLNCLSDLSPVAINLRSLVKPGGRVLLCLWSRFCISEMIWYLAHGQPKKAIRRTSGKAITRIGDITMSVFYPTVRAVRRVFSPWFHLESRSAVGLFVPPSYAEQWMRQHHRALMKMESLDDLFAGWRILRDVGDHVLLEFVRCKP